MSNYPNMMYELLEAVHEYYEDEPDVEVDVYLYLTGLRNNLSATNKLANEVENRLTDMNRCPCCGNEMVSVSHREYHSELDGCPYENVSETYCPYCGLEGD